VEGRSETGKILVFRTYPGPKRSWKNVTVMVDGRHGGKVGGAGTITIATSPGEHELVVRGPHSVASRATTVNVAESSPALVLVAATSGESSPIDTIAVRQVARQDELPKSCIPLFSPSGNAQSYRAGRNRAYVALVVLIVIALGLLVAGVVTLTRLSRNGGAGIGFLIFEVIGIFLLWKLRPGVRLVWNQRDWPLPDWRVNEKGDELIEWRRLSSETPGPRSGSGSTPLLTEFQGDPKSSSLRVGQLSTDTLTFWTGSEWISAFSPDGQVRWDGSRWGERTHGDVT
jgi:hypothetical protein